MPLAPWRSIRKFELAVSSEIARKNRPACLDL